MPSLYMIKTVAVDMPFVICRSTTFDLVNRSKQKEKGSGSESPDSPE